MKRTMADLKRDAKSGHLSMELMPSGMWAGGVPDRLKGRRRAVGAKARAVILENADGKESELGIDRAGLLEYTDCSLKVYRPGYREPTADEKKVLDEWKAVTETDGYRERAASDALCDGSSTYWQEVSFFEGRGMEDLMGFREQKGMRLDINRYGYDRECIQDAGIRGELILEYRVYHD